MRNTLAVLFCLMISTVSPGQTEEVRSRNFNTKKDIALEGYDPVSYFTSAPKEGQQAYKTTYKGVTYLFVSQANLDAFKRSPEMYEPAFGGWCAYAMGESGDKVKVDPETFKILDGRLYLFYNFWGNNTLEKWNMNEKTLKTKGEQNWRKFVP